LNDSIWQATVRQITGRDKEIIPDHPDYGKPGALRRLIAKTECLIIWRNALFGGESIGEKQAAICPADAANGGLRK
jgi:hypothetical protein